MYSEMPTVRATRWIGQPLAMPTRRPSLAGPRSNRCRAATERCCDRDGRSHAQLGHHLAIVLGGPRRPMRVGEFNARCIPGGAKVREMAQHCVRGRDAALPTSDALDLDLDQAGPVA